MEESSIKKLVVFAGNNKGNDSIYDGCKHLLEEICKNTPCKFLHGGGNGLMNLVREICDKYNVKHTGVLLDMLYKLKGDEVLDDNSIIIDKISDKKKYLLLNGDIFLVLPGGTGTLDELFNVLTWDFLSPIIIYNVNGYYDNIVDMISKMRDNGFSNSLKHRRPLIVTDNIDQIISYIQNYDPNKEETIYMRDKQISVSSNSYKNLLRKNY
ncbi:Hydrolase; related to cytokinin riboside 5'-monophosphate phosphoribohydrolase [Orpheovirus IHUMI-LCC2]|uniref:Hydrolase related to cytokinin riboside 5'-monophosphate phosphoribohydrolase n=1 Tax=Orpheovirus IHUMI-LCC2 TaxID=2023057 RepID=A0A2I2L3F0_9VIRU|nr:Hydrolase; related to cytokinin riboside 5'-monophosphate phosphoribohydrolase [Orpheovirus IHUMI-LCC2]SNW62068.1 Hydrolase; related to cytokinin riboside 5'-monophosphate phosphoribohydrolase [Orpheovirus IHUMI-LCC2]